MLASSLVARLGKRRAQLVHGEHGPATSDGLVLCGGLMLCCVGFREGEQGRCLRARPGMLCAAGFAFLLCVGMLLVRGLRLFGWTRADRGFRFRTYISKGELVLISSKGRYALRLAVCVAQAGPDAKVSLREVAEHEELSLKYLEQIARPMVSAGLLTSVRGKGGGYRLSRDPHEILAGDVLRAVEGTTVTCASLEGPEPCHRAGVCTTVRFWAGLDEVIENYVDGVTVGDLADAPQPHIQLADAAPAES